MSDETHWKPIERRTAVHWLTVLVVLIVIVIGAEVSKEPEAMPIAIALVIFAILAQAVIYVLSHRPGSRSDDNPFSSG